MNNKTYIIGFILMILCIFIIFLILIQNPKKDQTINQFFTEKNFRFFGIKRTNTLLENITWILSIIMLLLIILLNHFLILKS
ncbi:preprotein translocase subunit SecG [Blattabacterium cuenoti]|uniref:preprotein translocase subunit SecG n=1 Tax=Blattabacterium cuenoti TaxID=1653831 RepID=UPI00163C03BE|nr:preprotein translocase subunit SecG [Blattabacterium cuenoti]